MQLDGRADELCVFSLNGIMIGLLGVRAGYLSSRDKPGFHSLKKDKKDVLVSPM
jgi:hypothetical protein